MEQIITLNGIAPSKQTVEQIRNEIAQKVELGEIDAIKINASIKFFEKIFNGDDKKNNGLSHIIRPYVVDEIQKAPGRSDYYGFKVEIKEAGARYDFSNCNHSKLNELYKKQEELKKEIEGIEKLLKGLPQGGSMILIDEETGESYKVYAPVKKSTTSPVFTLSK